MLESNLREPCKEIMRAGFKPALFYFKNTESIVYNPKMVYIVSCFDMGFPQNLPGNYYKVMMSSSPARRECMRSSQRLTW